MTQYTPVLHPKECYKDILQTKEMSQLLMQKTTELAISSSNTLTFREYVDFIKRDYNLGTISSNGKPEIDWEKLGHDWAPFFQTVPTITNLSGLSDNQHDDVKEENAADVMGQDSIGNELDNQHDEGNVTPHARRVSAKFHSQEKIVEPEQVYFVWYTLLCVVYIVLPRCLCGYRFKNLN